MTMRAPLLAFSLLMTTTLGLVIAACGSSTGPASPIECDTGGVTCIMDNICCPAAQPYYCGGPTDPNNLGCYATLKEATAVCGTETGADGGAVTLAYKCQ